MFFFLTSCCQKLREWLMEKERLLVHLFLIFSVVVQKFRTNQRFLVKNQDSGCSYCTFSFLLLLFSALLPFYTKELDSPILPNPSFQSDGWFIIPAYVLLLCMINLMESKWWAPYAAAVLSRVGRLIYHCTLSQGGHLLLIQTTGRDVNPWWQHHSRLRFN